MFGIPLPLVTREERLRNVARVDGLRGGVSRHLTRFDAPSDPLANQCGRLPSRIANAQDAVTRDRVVHAVRRHHAKVILHRLRAFEIHAELAGVSDQRIQI